MVRGMFCRHGQNNDEKYMVKMSLKNQLYFHQKPEVTNDEYLKEFKAKLESFDDYSACILRKSPCLVETKIEKTYSKNVNDKLKVK